MCRLFLLLACSSLWAGCSVKQTQPSIPDSIELDEPDAAEPPDARPDATPPDARLKPCDRGNAQLLDPATGNCYMRFTTPQTYSNAKATCMVAEARMLTINSEAEQVLVGPFVGMQDGWLGATDTATEMTFVWETAEPFTYTKWRAGEPNDGGDGPAGTKENCAIIEGARAEDTWDDRPCGLSYVFVCERPPTPI